MEEEVAFHLETRAAKLVARGWTPEAARAEALRRFGALERTMPALRDAVHRRERRLSMRERIDDALQDVRHATRALARQPGFAGLVVATIALAIAVNASMFGVIDRLLLRGPAHVVDADQVRRVYFTWRPEGQAEATTSWTSYATYADLRDGARSLAGIAAYTVITRVTIGTGPDVQQLEQRRATWTLFPLLGIRPHVGRFFGPAEDHPPRGENVAVLGYHAWRTHFGGARDVVGRSVTIDGEPHTIIGVAPEGFSGPELEPVDVWRPVSVGELPGPAWPTIQTAKWLHLVARPRPGATPEQIDADVTAAHRRAYAGNEASMRDGRLSLRPLHFTRNGQEAMELKVARWLVGVAAVVLLVACANVANLLLARALGRRREIAVRLALGSGRGRLVRLLLAESAVLVVAGAAAGLVLASWGGRLLRSTLLPNVAWDAPPVDARVLAFTALATVLTALLVGLLPALRASRPALTSALKEGTRQGGSRSRVRSALVMAQAALSVVLLVGAGLFVVSLWNVRGLDLGIETDRVVSVYMEWQTTLSSLPPAARDGERERRARARERIVAELSRRPDVASAALGIGTPFSSAISIALRVPGRDSIPELPGGGPYLIVGSGDYFTTMGTKILRGRAFTSADRAGSERVAIVNQTMARTLWPTEDPIGRCLVVGDSATACSRIVGVAQDARRFSLREDPGMQYYVPLGQQPNRESPTLLVRPRGEARAAIPVLREALRAIEPTIGYMELKVLQDRIEPQVRPWRLGATLFVLFGTLALVVAVVGLFSVLSYTAAQRTHEFGVRVAIGARPVDILTLIVRHGLATTTAGVLAGAALALAAGRFIEPLLFDTSARNPAVFAAVTTVLLAAALVASLVPALRATRVDPMTALRAE